MNPAVPEARDLRAVLLGVVAWGTALLALGVDDLPVWVAVSVALVAAVRRRSATVLGLVVVAAAVLLSTHLHVAPVHDSPVSDLAQERATVTVVVVITSEPVRRTGRFGETVRFRATVVALTGRGHRYLLRSRIQVVLDDPERSPPVLGTRVRLVGRLVPAFAPDLAGELRVHGEVQTVAGPGRVAVASATLRRAVRVACDRIDGGAAALVPALVDGDEGAHGGTDPFAADFQVAGMTHLLAVSGTNLTLMVGALVLLARWCRVRAHGLVVVGFLGVVGFILLAGPEPSVLRAAAMGTVALIGLGRAGPGRGLRALGVGVLVLVLLDPWLARSIGFALSVVATAGILVLAPGWRARLARWLPAPVADALAVPLAAQLACTPVVAAISGQVSLIAVAANLVAAPLVGPATVLGLLGGAVALVSVPLGQLVAVPAGWAASGIIAVAEQAASLPVPAVPWATTGVAIAALTGLCLAAAVVLGGVLARPVLTVVLCLVLTVLVLVPVPVPGWPPAGWVFVACDVGQGDALVLRVGRHSAAVVDAGPDPRLVDRCLGRLGVRSIPVVVLTHFHADHVDGLPGVLKGRRVGRIDTSPLADPVGGARAVRAQAGRAGVPVRVVEQGESTRIGPISWQVLGPVRVPVPDSDSPPNDASVVLLVESAGIRLLLLGDEERPAQRDLHQAWPGLRADVLKVAHHGSANQDPELNASVGARLAVISVGRDNDYGHPARSTVDMLGRDGMKVLRTDSDGDVAVVVHNGRISAVTRR